MSLQFFIWKFSTCTCFACRIYVWDCYRLNRLAVCCGSSLESSLLHTSSLKGSELFTTLWPALLGKRAIPYSLDDSDLKVISTPLDVSLELLGSFLLIKWCENLTKFCVSDSTLSYFDRITVVDFDWTNLKMLHYILIKQYFVEYVVATWYHTT